MKKTMISLIVVAMFAHLAHAAAPLVRADGTYVTRPLAKDVVVLKVIQSGAESITSRDSAQAVIRRNLDHMVDMLNKACSEGSKPDIVLFHEFPLTGYLGGTRTEKLDLAIEIPGPETGKLGLAAKACDAYVIFGAFAKDSDWPGHILSVNTVIDRTGQVARRIWKLKNVKRFYPDTEITTTTIESVRDRFRAKYGIEEEFPIVHTEFGNLAVSTVQLDPLVFSALAMRGAEILLRNATLFFEADVVSTAQFANVYSAMANIPFDSPYGGNSLIVAPNGSVLARHPVRTEEGIVSAEIPIAKFRKGRRIPQFSTELVQPVLREYVPEIPLNHLDVPQARLPEDGRQMKTLLDQVSRWNR